MSLLSLIARLFRSSFRRPSRVGWATPTTAARRLSPASRRRMFLEPLEERVVFNGDPTGIIAALNGNQLVINGTSAPDVIVVDQLGDPGAEIRVLDNGTVAITFANSAVASASITGGDGTDDISIDWSFGARPATILGGSGDDTLTGGLGSDYLDGGAGNDFLNGDGWSIVAPGADVLLGGDGDDIVEGCSGNDQISGGNGDDTLWGDGADDVINGDAGADAIDGGLGNDTIYADVADTSATFFYHDGPAVWGSDGTDILNMSAETADITFTNHAGSAFEVIILGSGNDTIDSSAFGGGVTIIGYGGNDTLIGGDGNDYLDGVDGEDTLLGNGGDDTLIGTNPQAPPGASGADKFDGGAGNDTIYADASDANAATPLILGGTGSDSLSFRDETIGIAFDNNTATTGGFEYISGGHGNDMITNAGSATSASIVVFEGNDTLIGGSGNDFLQGATGDDSLIGLEGADVFSGGDGSDTVDYSASPAASIPGYPAFSGVIADLRPGATSLGGHAEGDHYTADDIEHLIGTPYSDYLIGNLADNLLEGLAGDDQIVGNDGNDTVLGGLGNDTLQGQDGIDAIDGGAGDDYLYADAADLSADPASLEVLGGDGSADVLDFAFIGDGGVTFNNDFTLGATTGGFETILGSRTGDDTLTTTGPAPNLYYVGFGGNDTLIGGPANDYLDGSDGDDSLTGAAGNDSLAGNAGNDNLTGDAGNDSLSGDAGDDFFEGGQGNDSIDGGDGADTLLGDSGDDILNGSGGDDLIAGGDDNDTLNGGDHDDWLVGDGGNDIVRGDAGDDWLDGGTGENSLEGGAGDNTLEGFSASPTIQLDLNSAVREGSSLGATVWLSEWTDHDVLATLEIHDGDGNLAAADWQLSQIAVTIPAGQNFATIPLSTFDDSLLEGPETFTIWLVNPTGASLGAGDSTSAEISDNDDGIWLAWSGGADEATSFNGFLLLSPGQNGGLSTLGTDNQGHSFVATVALALLTGTSTIEVTISGIPSAYGHWTGTGDAAPAERPWQSDDFPMHSEDSFFDGQWALIVASGVLPAMPHEQIKYINETVVSKSYIDKINGNIGQLPTADASIRLANFATTTDASSTVSDGAVMTPAADGKYRLRAQLDVQLGFENGHIVVIGLHGDSQGGKENERPAIFGTHNLKTRMRRLSDSEYEIDWRTWGRPNAVVEPAFQVVYPRSSKNIWHEGVLLVQANPDDSLTFTVNVFRGSDFPSHKVWIGDELRQYLPQGQLSSLWRSELGRGREYVTEDGRGPFYDEFGTFPFNPPAW